MSRPSTRTSTTAPTNFSYPATNKTSHESVDAQEQREQMDTTNKQPSYSTTALNITPPTLTFSPPSTRSASTHSEMNYLKSVNLVSRLRLLLSLVILASSTAILASQAHSLFFYSDTHVPDVYHLSLWPTNTDLRPTIAAIAISSIAVIGALIYILIAMIPSPRPLTPLLSHTFTLSTLLTLPTSIFLLAFTSYLHYHPTSSTTIRDWTCTFTKSAQIYNHGIVTGIFVSDTAAASATNPSGFSYLCMENEASWGLMIGVVGLELLAVVLVCYASKVEGRIRKERRSRSDSEKGHIGGMRGLVSHMSW